MLREQVYEAMTERSKTTYEYRQPIKVAPTLQRRARALPMPRRFLCPNTSRLWQTRSGRTGGRRNRGIAATRTATQNGTDSLSVPFFFANQRFSIAS
ncbi:MAG: hypothetical protein ACLRSW_10855 [Christensenellaceae bacterium]